MIAPAGQRQPTRYRHADEATLLAWARSGDEIAFGILADGARRRLQAVCFRACDDAGDAADACQEALLAAWLNLDRFRGESGFATWLCAIGLNAARAIGRKRRPTPMEIDSESLAQPDSASSVDLRDRVHRALGELDEPLRTAVVLREYGGLSYDEIAAATGAELNTVRTRIHRGRRQLAELLKEVPE
jgi:RNA polymerase sigma-70 factor (ECF subfamily)